MYNKLLVSLVFSFGSLTIPWLFKFGFQARQRGLEELWRQQAPSLCSMEQTDTTFFFGTWEAMWIQLPAGMLSRRPLLLARLREAAEEAAPMGTSFLTSEHYQPRSNIWNSHLMLFLEQLPLSTLRPCTKFWSYIMIQAQAANPNLVNRRTDSGTPHQFTKTKTGLQRIAVGYRAIQTVEEQSEQLCFPTLQAWHVNKPGRHWFSNTLVH